MGVSENRYLHMNGFQKGLIVRNFVWGKFWRTDINRKEQGLSKEFAPKMRVFKEIRVFEQRKDTISRLLFISDGKLADTTLVGKVPDFQPEMKTKRDEWKKTLSKGLTR